MNYATKLEQPNYVKKRICRMISQGKGKISVLVLSISGVCCKKEMKIQVDKIIFVSEVNRDG